MSIQLQNGFNKPFINKNKCYNDITKRPYKIHKNAI